MTSSFSALFTLLFATFTSVAFGVSAVLAIPPANDTLFAHQCISLLTWSTPGFRERDCYITVSSKAFSDELGEFGDDPVEFYSGNGGGVPPKTTLPQQEVPRKYVFGTCTLTIAMFLDFKSGDIPGIDPGTLLPRRDLSTYQQISTVAHFLLNRCIDVGQTGWYADGTRKAIGVFLWATDSEIDRSIHAVNIDTAANVSTTSSPTLAFNETGLEVKGLRGSMLVTTL